MNLERALAEFEMPSGPLRGSRFVLFSNRLFHQGSDSMETIPLGQVASVRVAFERDARKLNAAVVLLLAALVLAAISAPLQGWIASLAGGVKEQAGRESFDAVLLAAASALAGAARLLVPLAAVLAAIAVALLYFFQAGLTTLTLSFAATERAISVRGRNLFLTQFAEAISAQVAMLPAKGGG